MLLLNRSCYLLQVLRIHLILWFFIITLLSLPCPARAYVNSLPEHDANKLKLCSACHEGFSDYLRSVPQPRP